MGRSRIVTRKRGGLFAGPTVFSILYFGTPFAISPEATAALACTLWIAIWWVSEAIPIPATSLLPVVLFPITGVLDISAATGAYADPIVFLLLGGFLLAIAIERWELHRRIALEIVSHVGVRTDRLLLGFMIATAFLSMWISNSATAMLMVPIGAAVVVQFGPLDSDGGPTIDPDGSDTDHSIVEGLPAHPDDLPASTFGIALMLGIAYSASIGGMATLIGSPPNAVLAGVAESSLGIEITFAEWLIFAGPLSVVFLLFAWQFLLVTLRPRIDRIDRAEATIETQAAALGRLSSGERRVLFVFGLVATGWLLRPFVIQPIAPAVTDTAIAIVGGILLFVIPSGEPEAGSLLRWEDTVRVPWGVLVLLGAGFSLARAFQESGLDAAIADGLGVLADAPLFVLLLVVGTVVVFLTEVTSNTATATVFMPIMISLGLSLGVLPLTLMATAALAASLAFMLPVATPPNAVVFGSGYVSIPQMSRTGFWLNLFGIVSLVVLAYAWLPIAFGLFG